MAQEMQRTHWGLRGRGRTWTPLRQESREGQSGAEGWGGSSGGQSSSEEPWLGQGTRVQLHNLHYSPDRFVRSAARWFKFDSWPFDNVVKSMVRECKSYSCPTWQKDQADRGSHSLTQKGMALKIEVTQFVQKLTKQLKKLQQKLAKKNLCLVVYGPRFQMVTLLSVLLSVWRRESFIYIAASSHLCFNAKKVSQFPHQTRHHTKLKTPGRGWLPDWEDFSFTVSVKKNMVIKKKTSEEGSLKFKITWFHGCRLYFAMNFSYLDHLYLCISSCND